MKAKTFPWLGAPEDVDIKAWSTYFKSLRASLLASWRRTHSAYMTLKTVRETLGLPFIVDKTGETDPPSDAWTTNQDRQLFNLQAVVQFMLTAADDVVNNKRRIGWDGKEFVVERLPGDAAHVGMVQNQVFLLDNSTNQPIQASGPVSALGLAPIAWVGLGIVGVAVTVAGYLTVKSMCESATSVMQQKTLQTLSNNQHELVMSGKAEPAEASAMTKSLLQGAADLEKAQAATALAKKEPDTDLGKTIRTVAIVGLGAAALYLVAQFVGARRMATA